MIDIYAKAKEDAGKGSADMYLSLAKKTLNKRFYNLHYNSTRKSDSKSKSFQNIPNY